MDQGQFYSAFGAIWVLGFAAVLLIALHLKNKRRLEKFKIIHEERMKAMEKGIPLPEFPDLEETKSKIFIGGAIGRPAEGRPWNPRWPLGVGALLIMGGLGTSVAMRMSSDFAFHSELWPFGLIAVFVGVGMFLFYYLTRSPSDKT